MKDWYKLSLESHRRFKGKLETASRFPLEKQEDLSLAYTPGVAACCEAIANDPAMAQELTIIPNTVAIVTDGSSVLGLGNIGPKAAMPVMEGKALLFKKFANIDAWPICVQKQDVDSIVATIENIAPSFGGINLEDIAAPKCFEVERRLQHLGIPVVHDDQHGTAIVVMAALMNASKIVGKAFNSLKVTVLGSGAAGTAIAKILVEGSASRPDLKVDDVIVCDSKGAVFEGREDLNASKAELARVTNKNIKKGSLSEVLKDSDVFIGVSRENLLTQQCVQSMADNAIIFALANPNPEILPDVAYKGGAAIYASGRSDLPNQVNNALVFPGLFRGALDAKAPQVNACMRLAAAEALAASLADPHKDKILPCLFNFEIPMLIAAAVREAAQRG